MRPCLACHYIHLADDLVVAHLKRRFDYDPAPIRVLASLPEHHPIFVSDSSLDSVRSLLTEGHSQMLGYIRFSAKLEGQGVRGVGVDDAQLGLFGVEDEHGVQIAVLDGVAQSLEVQPFVSLSPPHLVHRATLAS